MVRFSASFLALLLLINSGCSGAPDDPLSAPPDGVALSVKTIEEVDEITSLGPSKSEHRFVVIKVALVNGSENGPTSTAPVLFYLESDVGLQYLASAQTALLKNACTAEALLSAGHHHQCMLAFELPHGQLPATLHYRNERDDAASTPASIEHPCTPCANRCVDLRSDAEHCGACYTPIPKGGSCLQGVPTCPDQKSACAAKCVDLTKDLQHCGACNTPVPKGGTCEGIPHCPGGLVNCSSTCVNLNADDLHCGSCGTRCSEICLVGICVKTEMSEERETCDVVCSSHGSTCAGDHGWNSYYDPQDSSHSVRFEEVPCNAMPPATAEYLSITYSFERMGCVCVE